MIRILQNNLPVLKFSSLSKLDGLVHAVTTRQGGVSDPPFDSLNLAGAEDSREAIQENLSRLCKAMGLKELVQVKQVHGREIKAAEKGDAAYLGEGDGLVTDRPGLGLLVKQADCQAVILAAPGKAVANLHAGWRGNVADMPGYGVEFLEKNYHVDPGEIHAAVSPSLGPCCAEFTNHATELGRAFLPYEVSENHFDLWRVTFDQLTARGVKPENIEISGLCTKCGREFFSYRREGKTGRFGTVAALTRGEDR
ncbi:polyphenol oxidase family protein [Dethiosulfatarculus sandiegensis]|uniref:polyphenol oxidase family protein n=1 Tax=Dethiosulfatarculus sandiegensis TaxID=1429043 RepID=UPI0005C8563A|nr:polyphenol oxidase family protein [Dethiosulfatarculus sandiegensis]